MGLGAEWGLLHECNSGGIWRTFRSCLTMSHVSLLRQWWFAMFMIQLITKSDHYNLGHAIRKHWNTIDHVDKTQPHNVQAQVSWTKLQRIHGGYLTPKQIGTLLKLFMVLGMPLSRCTKTHFGFCELVYDYALVERTFVINDYWIVKPMSFHPFNHKGYIVANPNCFIN
jgi:hypothetical protein